MKKKMIASCIFIGLFTVALTAPAAQAKGNPGKNVAEAGNNLSFPVLWAEGVTKTLPGTLGMAPMLGGEWWYQWGTNGVDPNITPASCLPDPDGSAYCDNGVPGSVDVNLIPGNPVADNPLPLVKAYLQKDPDNTWQAGSANWSDAEVNVHWIDWSDSLESVDWYTRSQVRLEVVLFEDLDPLFPMTEYEMRHVSGWGIDEVHGLAASLDMEPVAEEGSGAQATVYSPCARLTVQKLLIPREDVSLEGHIWNWQQGEGWSGYMVDENGQQISLINAPILNQAAYEGGDGPGYFSAEINVKGRIIYGYTWNVRRLNDLTQVPPYEIPTPAGDYRITFSFDETCPTVELNTFFIDGTTKIIVPLEEELVAAFSALETESTDDGGAIAELDPQNNLTYMDVRILERGGGNGRNNK